MLKIKFKLRDLAIFIVLALVSNYLTIRLSYISGDIINKIYDQSLMEGLGRYILGLILFIGLAMAFLTLKNSYKFKMVARELGEFRSRLYRKILDKELASLKGQDPSYYHNLLYSDTETIRLNYLTSKLIIIDNSILFLAAGAYITSIHPIFLVIALLSTFIPYLIPKLFEKKLDRQRLDYSESAQDYIAFVKEGVLGIDTIRDYSIEDEILDDYRTNIGDLLKKSNRLADIQNIIGASSIFSGFFMYVFVLSSGVYFYSKGLISIGEIIVASQLTNNIKSPLISIINNKIDINSTKSLREKIFPFLEGQKRQVSLEGFRLKDRLEIRDLAFSYDGERMILDSLNLDIRRGKKYLLIGSSGSGKSTFLKLLMRWYSDYSGQILVDGRQMEDIGLESWNGEFVPVLQESFIFDRSLAFNIALSYDYDDDKIARAVRLAGLKGLVDSLDQGLETPISEGGSNISGGEKKRIGIARALYRDGGVLLLDEPFSSLDHETQTEIEEVVLNLEDKTILNISHNYDANLMKKYDYVINFKDGSAELSETSKFVFEERGEEDL